MISIEEIQKLAGLCRLAVSDEEAESLRKDIDGILAYVGQIQKASSFVAGKRPPPALRNVLRSDSEPHKRGIFTEALISASPNRQGNFVRVKKIL